MIISILKEGKIVFDTCTSKSIFSKKETISNMISYIKYKSNVNYIKRKLNNFNFLANENIYIFILMVLFLLDSFRVDIF